VHTGQVGEEMRLRYHEIELSQVLLELHGSRNAYNHNTYMPFNREPVNHVFIGSVFVQDM
jgi:hypothetical protein